MEIYEIPPKVNKDNHRVLNVAAYCRVSSASDEQLSSLEAQKSFYKTLIDKNPDWVNIGIFADVGSGKNLKSRSDFVKMLKLCRKGKIDLILTKSVSRFGRNTVDTLSAINEFRALGIDVWFETGGIRLSDDKFTSVITMLSIFAQAESESKSANIKFGILQSFRSGNAKIADFICYGYKKDKDGGLIIDNQQAKVVRLIFKLYLHGNSLGKISKELERRKIPSPTGKKIWSRQTIDKLLRNEKLAGNVMLQKTYIDDFFSGKQVKNTGQRERYLIRNHHVGIVPEQVFDAVQAERDRRRQGKNE